MALPTSRDLTLTDGASSIPAALINNIQDQIIGGKHAAAWISGFPIMHGAPASWVIDGGTGGHEIRSTGVGGFSTWVQGIRAGDRVVGARVIARGDSVADCTYEVHHYDAFNTWTVLGTILDSNRSPAFGTVTIPITPKTLAVGDTLSVYASANAAGIRWRSWSIQVDCL